MLYSFYIVFIFKGRTGKQEAALASTLVNVQLKTSPWFGSLQWSFIYQTETTPWL